MRKYLKRITICTLFACVVWLSVIVSDKVTLQKELIRLHVVAASDTEADQSVKLLVRDAVVNSLRENMEQFTDVQQARAYLQENLSQIEMLANFVLQENGFSDSAHVSLRQEEFGTRVYDTFTLPAGVYESLRITIGEGQGQNWWCVVFPTLCVGATVGDFEETAQCAGLRESLTATLAGEKDYEVRFFVLDAIGRLENFLHKS